MLLICTSDNKKGDSQSTITKATFTEPAIFNLGLHYTKTPFTSEPYKFGGIIAVRERFFMAGYISRFIVGVLQFKTNVKKMTINS